MTRYLTNAGKLLVICLLAFTLNSCLKDHCNRTYTLYTPVYKTLAEARAAIKSIAPQPLEHTGKIYLYGNYIFLNERNKGIHIIDNSKPNSPVNMSFIPVAGNMDMAVKNNTLLVDMYGDLVAIDIANPKQVAVKKFLPDVFPHRQQYVSANVNPDSIKVIVDWKTRDTTVECETYQRYYEAFYSLNNADKNGNYAAPQTGIGGSMARFTVMNDYLYTVTNAEIRTIDIHAPQDPFLKDSTILGWNIETIYPFKDKLFIGSSTGMFIYDVTNAASPAPLGQFAHVRSCDPVIADDYLAYVTLSNTTMCQGTINRLDVMDIKDLAHPKLLKSYDMTAPQGLSKDGNLLFVCDGKDGLKVYDATDPLKHKLVKQLTGMDAYDVITWNNRALVVAKQGLFQFDFSTPTDMRLLSKIVLNR